MNYLEYLYFSFKRFKNNKKNLYHLILIIFLNFILLSILAFSTNFLEFINNTITKNIGFRSLNVSPNLDKEDYGLSLISNLKYVKEVYNSKYDSVSVKSSFENNYFDGSIDLNYANINTLPENVIGSKFSDSDTNVAICPINFYPSSEAYNLIFDNKNILNGYDLLDTDFTVKYYSTKEYGGNLIKDKEYTKIFKIIGLYNSNDLIMPSNSCYISFNDIKEINDIVLKNNTGIYSFIVVVDKKDNVSKVIKELEDLGFKDSEVRMHLDTTLTDIISLASKIVTFIIILAIVFLTISLIKKRLIDESKYIGILKTHGFMNKSIICIYTLEIFLINLIAYIISLIIFLVFYLILKNTLLSSLIYSGFIVKLFIIIYIISILITILIPVIISILAYNKCARKNTISLVRSS